MELKLLEKRIDKAIEECDLIKVKTRSDNKLDAYQFSKDAQSSYDKAVALMERRDLLKSALSVSNATTTVKIGDKTYTVCDVIDRKRNLENKRELLERMRTQRKEATELYEKGKEIIRSKLDRLLEIEFGKDIQSNSDNVKSITDNYLNSNKVELLDPLNLGNKIKALDEFIDEFDKEADLILSETNAVTFVEV
jgi:hypothetical protein